jgi:hypothetical protein
MLGDKKPSHLLHVGNPLVEKPHESMDRFKQFHKDHPDVKVVIILWEKDDIEAVEKLIDKDRCRVFHWKDDLTLQTWLMDSLSGIFGAQIVAPRWYACPNSHYTRGTYSELLEKCPECDLAITIVEPFKERLQKFAEVFQKVIQLASFDTQSGQFLHTVVNPTRNVLLNMPYALGCEHKPGLTKANLGWEQKDHPVFLCAAGPSLEDAIPELQRLQDKGTIVCVGRSFKLLRAHDIRVDFTVSVEMFDWDSAIFADLTKEEVGDTILCYASVCSPETVKTWPGERMCLWDISTADLLKRDDAILGGNSVAHHMLNFACQILDAKTVYLVGYDLSYTKPRTHATGTIHGKWPKEIQEQEEKYHQNELWVPSTGKGTEFHPECHRTPIWLKQGFAPSNVIEVRSSHSYKQFCTLLEILVNKHSGTKVYNTCPNGQKVEGTEYRSLKDVK